MYRNKKDVDKHVENLLHKLSPKDFKIRAYTIARLYYEVGDYGSCQKYVEQYLSLKSGNAAAHKLLGLALQKLGEKEKALEQFKISLDIDPSQTATILDVCELLADEEVTMEVGRAKYWCEKAEGTFPKHAITFRLKERLLSKANPDPVAFEELLKSELAARPKDAILHSRLLKHYMQTNQIKQACIHSCNVEFDNSYFTNNFPWYETLTEILNCNQLNKNDWIYQLLLLTVKEKLCHLSLTDVPNSTSKNLVECSKHLLDYDQSIKAISMSTPPTGCVEFHRNLLQHHSGQLAFHTATYLLKKDQISWSDATKYSTLLMLKAWQTEPLDLKINWLSHAPNHQQNAARQWFLEGSYRCSQAGHYITANFNNNYVDLEQITQLCSGTHWRDKLFEKIFTNQDQLSKMESSYIVSASFTVPAVKLPQISDVQKYDSNAQRFYPNSLHHFVWMLLNYKQMSEFKCTLFDMLSSSMTGYGPETLSKIDVLAFLYCATLTTASKKDQSQHIVNKDKPNILPANITPLLCTLPQMKWWDCAYKLSQNELGTEYTDIRSTLSRGIEVVRCIDNHGLDAELLCLLGRIFSSHANIATISEEKKDFEERALLFYSTALPCLERLKSNSTARSNNKRMFDYNHKNLGQKELNSLIEESKIYVAINLLKDGDYEKVVDLLSNLKSPQAYYHLGVAYKRIALDEQKHSKDSDKEAKHLMMLIKAKQFAYKGLHKIKETEQYQSITLYSDIQTLIEEIEVLFNKMNTDHSNVLYENDSKYLSDDECDSLAYGEPLTLRNHSNTYRNVSSTPKLKKPILNADNYRTAIDTQIFSNSQTDTSHIEQLEKQIKKLQHRDTTISDFMEQTKEWFQENRKLGNQIISTINNNIENTTEQFKLLRISVGQVKEQIDECRNECKDVADLKKQIAELKKEVNKLKKPLPEHPIDDNDIYNLEEEYRSSDNSTFGNQIPFAPQQIIPPFAQRLMPPFSVPSNPYLYGQNFYNLYNQFSQFPQTPAVPGAQPIFDPTRTHMNYSSMYPNPEQIYLDTAHLVPPNVTATPPVQTVPSAATSSKPPLSLAPPTTATKSYAMELKDMGKSLPVNVVITSSDPLPTCTTAPQPILSVTVPTKHIKGSPHNYQISMPTTITDVKLAKPPVYTFSLTGNPTATIPSSTSASSTFNQKPIFMTNQLNTTNKQDRNVKDLELSCSISSPNNSINKSRTLSEKSNTSIENYDPCPDFKPIVPLPAEVKVTTGEEDEEVIFKARAKLFRFTDKQWKERGIGEMKLLKHKITGKVRVLMRREQVHKICANHVILHEMEIKPMKNETKAYFWCANDFADETVILEKFCIRFKTADIAKQFYETFERSRQAAAINTTNKDLSDSKQDQFVKSEPKENVEKTEANKTVVGGFTFSSAPTFKAQSSVQNSSKPVQTPEAKVNVFSGITFKTNNLSLQNVFNTSKVVESPKIIDNSNSRVNKLNNSDTVEEYEPNVEFKPVVPLPALIDQKTGEEEENILFEHRAKLLRFDTATKEWKERGLGNIKLLEHKVNKKVRLLMRREQIMKICCNHVVTKEINFEKMPNMDKAVTWCAKDFSDGELVGETFCLRFKTVQACDDFIDAVKNVQFKSGDGAKAAKEEENAAKVAASTQGPQEPQKLQSTVSNISTPSSDWGDKFKPKANSWECSVCMIRNDSFKDHCCACNTPKDPKKCEKTKSTNENPSKFSFGIKEGNENTKNMTNMASKWGDQFKPKEGTWECQQCLVRNDGNMDSCSACNSLKDPSNVKNEPKLLFSNIQGTKFSFGISPDVNNTQSKDSTTSTLFGTQTNQKFTFGIPQNTPQATKTNGSVSVSDNETPRKPALLETPKGIKPIMESSNITPFGENKGAFDFSFTPKSSSKGKSPVKTPATDKDDDSDNEYASEDEGHHIHFSPVILVPDKIKVVTGEEDEDVLYAHRAKLYIFVTGEWKERGIGTVKILKHKNSGKLRVLMRREQVFKICLNHSLTPEIIYKEKDEKTWIFAANDFSEEELVMSKFCLRFSNKEIAQEFKNVVDRALLGISSDLKTNKDSQDADDVVFISELQATSEEKKKAKDLMLPENFYTYKSKFPCLGCRGCDDPDSKTDEEKESSTKSALETKVSCTTTPFKTPVFAFQSPSNSFYGTPTNLGDKTVDTTVFRTPMQYNERGSSSANSTASEVDNETEFSTTSGATSAFSGCDKKDSSNTKSPLTQPKLTLEKHTFGESKTPIQGDNKSIFGEKKTIFGQNTSIFVQSKPVFGENKPLFTENKPIFGENKSIFGDSKPVFGENKPIFGENKPLFGENKTIFGENKTEIKQPTENAQPVFADTKSIFGENKSIFGGNKPVFGENKSLFGENKPIFGENKPLFGENKIIFGENKTIETKQPTENAQSVFGGPKSIFGENKPIFGENKTSNSSTTNKLIFGTNLQSDKIAASPNITLFNSASNPASIFSAAVQKPGLNFAKKDENESVSAKPIFGATKQFSFGSIADQNKIEPETKASSTNETKSTEVLPLKVDSSLSFAELSSSSGGFGGKKTNFQWEGAGQPLFGGAQKPASEKTTNESAADESTPAGTEEEYDPHYEPIVPLPDEIVVTTGEEDEEKLFSERCKLYRFDDKTKEWKERGVGELKILYHPVRKSYRLLQRREQVHKLVLNMLLFMDLELLPMKNSDRAWTWAGRNYAETAGDHETLAVRFKTPELALTFYDKVQECIRKLQVAAAEAIRKEKEEKENEVKTVTPLRLPKHLASSARADDAIAAKSAQSVPVSDPTKSKDEPEVQFDQTQSQENQEHYEYHNYGNEDYHTYEDQEQYEYENYGNEDYNDYEEYDHNENSDEYYNEEEEGKMYSLGKSMLTRNGVESVCEASHIEVTYDQEVGLPKIIVTDANTGEILAITRIEADTEFSLSDNICSWSGVDITTNSPVETSAKIVFNDNDKAMEFYDYCETSKAGTYTVENES